MGAEFSFPVALFAGPLPGADGQGLEHRLPYTLNCSAQLNQDTFLKEFSYSIGDISSLEVWSRSKL